jgi:hypothetical protein
VEYLQKKVMQNGKFLSQDESEIISNNMVYLIIMDKLCVVGWMVPSFYRALWLLR